MTKTKRKPRKRPARSITREKMLEMFGIDADVSAAGVHVGVSDAFGLSAFYACVRAISEDCSMLPLILYKKDGDSKTRLTDDPLYALLHDDANPEMSSQTFRETLIEHACAWGNGYAEIEQTVGGKPTALWPLPPTDVSVGRVNGQLVYKVQLPGTQPVYLKADGVFHLHGMGYDGILGYGLIILAKESLGAAIAAQRFSGSYYRNGASLSGILEHPGVLKPEALENLRRSWKERYQGSKNANEIAVLEQGLKFTPIGANPEQSQQVQTREFNVEDVCRWFRMPPYKIGHLARAAGWSTLEAMQTDYLTGTLMPWSVRLENEYRRKVIKRPNIYCEHLYEYLLRPDTTTRYGAYTQSVTNGWMSRNEVRVRENLEPVDGLDEYLFPSNLTTIAEHEQALKDAKAKAEKQEQQPPQPPQQKMPADDEDMMRTRLEGEIRSLLHSEEDKRGRKKFDLEQHVAECVRRYAACLRRNGVNHV